MPSKPSSTVDGLQFTSITVPPPFNSKNVTASFVRRDSQSWWGRRPSEGEVLRQEGSKRMRMMASEEELEAGKKENGAIEINVLKSAPAGSVGRIPVKKGAAEELETDSGYKTIVIHPGSRWLRIGRASDAFPMTVPNVIATRKLNFVPSNLKGKGKEIKEVVNMLPITSNVLPLKEEEIEFDDSLDQSESDPIKSSINSLRAELRARMRTFKLRGQANGHAISTNFNSSVLPQIADFNDPNEIDWTDVEGANAKEYYIGAKAERIPNPTESGYTLKAPYRSGTLHSTDYTSQQELLMDIERIWLGTLEELGITRDELKDYSAILVIPDLYDQVYVREMSELILGSIGFKQMCMQQESIAASFGLGLSTVTVVDIGAKKTSISCVEDGLILPETRVSLNFGGDDITEFLFTLLTQTNFPYREADLSTFHDWNLLQNLKEKMIVLSEMDVGLNLFEFYVRASASSKTRKYQFRSYDSVILAPYILFSPQVIDFEKKKLIQPQLWSKDVDDFIPIGSNITTLAMKNCCKPPPIPPTILELPAPISISALPTIPATLPITPATVESIAAILPATPAPLPTPSPPPPKLLNSPSDLKLASSQVPLHLAIIESILSAGTEDRQKRLSSAVLVCGATTKIHNLGFAIESRVTPILATRAPHLSTSFQIIYSPREIEPNILEWKGMSSLCKLDSCKDLWLRKDEWKRFGLRGLKEKHLFM